MADVEEVFTELRCCAHSKTSSWPTAIQCTTVAEKFLGAAPGITREWLNKSKEERCENPLVIPNFYNAEYNPNGEYNAITYCDGYVRDPDGSFEAKLGRLLPDTARTEPISVVLAIDLNETIAGITVNQS